MLCRLDKGEEDEEHRARQQQVALERQQERQERQERYEKQKQEADLARQVYTRIYYCLLFTISCIQ